MKSSPFGLGILSFHCVFLGCFSKISLKNSLILIRFGAHLKGVPGSSVIWLNVLILEWSLLPFLNETASVIFKKSAFDYCFYSWMEEKNKRIHFSWQNKKQKAPKNPQNKTKKKTLVSFYIFVLNWENREADGSLYGSPLDFKMFPMTSELPKPELISPSAP